MKKNKYKKNQRIAIAIVGTVVFFGAAAYFCVRCFDKHRQSNPCGSDGTLKRIPEECCHGITNADRKLNEAGCPKKGCSLEQEIKKAMGKVDAPSKVRTYKETEPFSGERHSHTEVSFDIEKCSGDIYAQAENAIEPVVKRHGATYHWDDQTLVVNE